MENKISEICLKLDDLALDILELSEELVGCKVKLEEAMKPGFVHIAKSRYIMGNKTVCSLQLPTEDSAEFDALVTVKREAPSNDRDSIGFHIQTVDPNSAEMSSSDHKTLRKRKDTSSEVCTDSDITDVALSKGSPSQHYVNPLNWFGVLVPQNLKIAQTCFKTTLPLVMECAHVQSKIQGKQLEYQRLIKEKSCL